jgi:hypothetical protein
MFPIKGKKESFYYRGDLFLAKFSIVFIISFPVPLFYAEFLSVQICKAGKF